MPLVSIIIPSYNRAGLVGDAIRSALAQTYRDCEVIVADDGSSDDTPAVVRAFGDAVRYDWQPNGGVEAARNRGAALACGSYLCFLDSDDMLRPHALAQLVALLDAHPEAGMAYGQTDEHDNAGDVRHHFQPPYARPAGVWSGQEELAHLLLGNYIHTGAVVMRRDAFDAAGGYRMAFQSMAEDWDMWTRIAGTWAVGYIPETMETMRFQPDGLTTRMDAAHTDLYLRNWQRMLETALDTPNGRAMSAAQRTRAQAFFKYKIAHLAYATHDTTAARQRLSEAVNLWPRLLLDSETREVRSLWLKLKVPDAVMERARSGKRHGAAS